MLYKYVDSVGKPPFSVIAGAFCEAIFPGLLRPNFVRPRNDAGRVFRHYHVIGHIFCWLFLIFVLPAQSQPIVAADSNPAHPAAQDAPGMDSLDNIKSDISALLEENAKLQEQYEIFKAQILETQTDINEQKIEDQKIIEETKQTQEFIEREKNRRAALGKKMERFQQEIATHDHKTSLLKKELADVDEKVQLWKLKISDLELQKNDLNLELKKQETWRQDIQSGETEELKKLKEQISAIESEEEKVTGSLLQAKSENQQIFAQINNLREENKNLEEQIAQVKKQREEKIQQNAQLQKEQGASQNKIRNEYLAKMKQKSALEAQIKQLENKAESVRKSLAVSLELQEQ